MSRLFYNQVILIFFITFAKADVGYRDVVIEQGTVRGYNSDNEGVVAYYGIPYATAPKGHDKFKDALAPPTWSDVFNATVKDIICIQKTTSHLINLNMTEDCLTVNVFVPTATKASKLPVLIYIHGGGYHSEYALEMFPFGVVAREVVFVNFNYRLGVYGFLCLGNEYAPGNAGLKDQLAALRWVKKNIASFGGNPEDITLAGYSAGAFSAELQLLSSTADGLFNKLILESGTALTPFSVTSEPLKLAQNHARQLGYEIEQDTEAIENFYRSLSDEQLQKRFEYFPYKLGFTPCVEYHSLQGVEKFLEEKPIDIIRNGNYEKRPIKTGFTPQDGTVFIRYFEENKSVMENNFDDFLPTNIEFRSEEEKETVAQRVRDFYFPNGEIDLLGFIYYYTDVIFGYPQLLSARLHTEHSVPIYLYYFNYNGSVNLPHLAYSPVWEAGHIAQTLYVLEKVDSSVYAYMVKEDYEMQELMRDIWVNFVKYGDPTPALTSRIVEKWLPLTRDKVNYYEINQNLTVKQSPLSERFALWDEIYGYF